ncbi:membrane-associated protein, putative [Bodo saltans]|uniref:Membrane-associated protein, putative n=1 Tax=Bodo saltans TaxID=75058 RepID=A0A0S4ISV0_BODSA|nr:membrane-associated protein, putative [Bodo saltans]|eukprot:CUG06215.1 membrane-associated protein, putative [Bodo saltans]
MTLFPTLPLTHTTQVLREKKRMTGKRRQLIILLAASVASVALAGFLVMRRRSETKTLPRASKQEQTRGNNRVTPEHHHVAQADDHNTVSPQLSADVTDEDVIVQKIPGSHQASVASDDDHIVVGHAVVDSPPIGATGVSLSGLPPLKIVPSLKLLKERGLYLARTSEQRLRRDSSRRRSLAPCGARGLNVVRSQAAFD